MTDPSNPASSTLAPAAASPPALSASSAPATPTAAPTVPVFVEPHSHAGISETEHAAMVGWARQDAASGKLSPEAATKLFDDLGVPPDQRTMPTDLRTEEQRVIDEQFPVGRAQDFRIAYADPGQPAPPMTKELAQFDQSARAWLVGAEFPRDLGNSLITTISKVAQQTKAMTEAQLEAYGHTEFQKLQQVYGTELEAQLNSAGLMVSELEKTRPGLKAFLKTAGVGDSALVASILIQQAERFWTRRGKRNG